MADIQIAKKSDLDGKANVGHNHSISDVTNLQSELDGKSDDSHNHDGVYQPAGNYAGASHTHAYSEITEKPTIPTNNNQLTNGAGYITSDDIPSVPTDNNELTNGAGYIDGSYDNTTSGLTATNMQGAIDELKSLIDGLSGA